MQLVQRSDPPGLTRVSSSVPPLSCNGDLAIARTRQGRRVIALGKAEESQGYVCLQVVLHEWALSRSPAVPTTAVAQRALASTGSGARGSRESDPTLYEKTRLLALRPSKV